MAPIRRFQNLHNRHYKEQAEFLAILSRRLSTQEHFLTPRLQASLQGSIHLLFCSIRGGCSVRLSISCISSAAVSSPNSFDTSRNRMPFSFRASPWIKPILHYTDLSDCAESNLKSWHWSFSPPRIAADFVPRFKVRPVCRVTSRFKPRIAAVYSTIRIPASLNSNPRLTSITDSFSGLFANYTTQ